jgi:SAM-dependent methyltransferase
MKSAAAFTCNICDWRGIFREEHWSDPEMPSCGGCGSNVRFRWLVHRLSKEIFGHSIPLFRFPLNASVKGIGLTDPACIAATLAERFTYLNTYLHAEPRFDVCSDPSPMGELDFLIASEVFEHVDPPVERAFKNTAALLKPSGVLLMTVPWVWDGSEPLPELYDWKLEYEDGQWIVVNRKESGQVETFKNLSFDDGPGRSLGRSREHFPHLHEWQLLEQDGSWRLTNTRADGVTETFHNLAFHGGIGATLEKRLFTKRGLEQSLRDAGFASVEFEFNDYPEFGINFGYPWSRPIVARLI